MLTFAFGLATWVLGSVVLALFLGRMIAFSARDEAVAPVSAETGATFDWAPRVSRPGS